MSTINFGNISKEFKQELYEEYTLKLKKAKGELAEAQDVVMKLQRKVSDYEELINALYPEVNEFRLDKSEVHYNSNFIMLGGPQLFDKKDFYDTSWTQKEKASYFIKNALNYRSSPMRGTNDVLDAMILKEPDLKRKREALKTFIGPTISRLIGEEIYRYKSKDNPNETFLIHKDWIESHDNRINEIFEKIEPFRT